MSTDPDQIRREIEATRNNLSSDVDALAYKVSPARIVDDRKQRARNALQNVRDKVMGSASDLGHSTKHGAHAVGETSNETRPHEVPAGSVLSQSTVASSEGKTPLVMAAISSVAGSRSGTRTTDIPPARAARTPLCASSNTRQCAGSCPSPCATFRKISGSGLPWLT